MGTVIKFAVYLIYILATYFFIKKLDDRFYITLERRTRCLVKQISIILGINQLRDQKEFIDAIVELGSISGGFNFKGESKGIKELPQYKFYTQLVYKFIQYCRRFGIPFNKIIINLRDGVVADHRFERKLAQEFRGGVFQFAFIAVVTWIFIYFASTLLNINPPKIFLIIIASLHLSGVLIFVILLRYLRLKIFGDFETFFHGLYTFQALSSIGLPLATIIAESDFDKIYEIKNCKFHHVKDRLQRLIIGLQQSGSPVEEEIRQLIGESWFLQEQGFEEFKNKQTGCKFLVITLFYLSSYFIFILSLFELFLKKS